MAYSLYDAAVTPCAQQLGALAGIIDKAAAHCAANKIEESALLQDRLYPDMFSLARAHLACTAEGRIADEQLQQRFDANISNFMELVEASTHYPCVKRAWVEYLGEHPEPSLDRVE